MGIPTDKVDEVVDKAIDKALDEGAKLAADPETRRKAKGILSGLWGWLKSRIGLK